MIWFRQLIILFVCLGLSACYYVQAARGQFELMGKREAIADLIADESTPPELVQRLRLVEQARAFSVDALGLPDNGSYSTYADLERDFAVWSVVAVPEFSVEPRQWCYPIVGCVSYRGYFSEQDARRKARSLREQGYDVALGGVAAYSTLGRFDDPVLNTMMHWDDVQLVAVIFHELAHQQLYIKDDTTFNESFATAVEEAGVERWLQGRDNNDEYQRWRGRKALHNTFAQLAIRTREDLEALYARGGDVDVMRSAKADALRRFSGEVTALYDEAGFEPPSWVVDELNNARLASVALYNQRVPEFRQLLADCAQDFRCFYERAEALGGET